MSGIVLFAALMVVFGWAFVSLEIATAASYRRNDAIFMMRRKLIEQGRWEDLDKIDPFELVEALDLNCTRVFFLLPPAFQHVPGLDGPETQDRFKVIRGGKDA